MGRIFALAIIAIACGSCGGKTTGGSGGARDLGIVFGEPDLWSNADFAICVSHCSDDGKQVLDCNGGVLTDCGVGEVCTGTMCTSPCEKARQDKNSTGCEYWVVDPGEQGLSNGACFAAIIANTSSVPAQLAVDYQGKKLNVADFARVPVGQGANLQYKPLPPSGVPAGAVAILFLAEGPNRGPDAVACPVPAAFTAADAASEVTSLIDAFHITATMPVVAYDIYPYGGAKSAVSSATLLIPTSAWDTNYLAIDAWPQSLGGIFQPFIQIAATQDGTTVTIRPTVNIVGGNGVAPATAGQKANYQLKKGQVLQLKQDAELNGSVISSNVPVGVWGGSSCINIDVKDTYCDAAHQQLFPVRALGFEYVAARHRDRLPGNVESPPWRILGAVDGTTLTYDAVRPMGAPATISKGQVVTFWTSDAFTVTSQDKDHPFYISGHMTSCNHLPNNPGQIGDPEFVNTVPPAQYLSNYDFFTDATMGYTHLVMVRKVAGDATFHEVTLDCLGTVKGWKSVGKTGQYEYAWVDLVNQGAPVGKCNNGFHNAHSDVPFGLTVWGWDRVVSYAYPAGAGVTPVNDTIIQ